jgi:hypothetical protein
MSYELLTSLYYGKMANADLVDHASRSRLHIPTPLDDYIPVQVAAKKDVILTGNPGDGKSHIVRRLEDRELLEEASVELDLSARPTEEVIAAWEAARAARRPFVLCANEGPLLGLIEALGQRRGGPLGLVYEDLRAQLGRLTVSSPELLPPSPKEAVLVDLADRNLLDERLIKMALGRVCSDNFLPPIQPSIRRECSAGRNLALLATEGARARLAAILSLAGRRAGGHFTFRHLWGAIAFSITAAKQPNTLTTEYYSGKLGHETYPLSYLSRSGGRGRGKGPLIEAVAAYADPACVSDPALDDELWSRGEPEGGSWALDGITIGEPPARMWARGDEQGALDELRHLKRLVALAHTRGEELIARLVGSSDALPSHYEDDVLLRERAFQGLQRLYMSASRLSNARPWLKNNLPLWVSRSYRDIPCEERPHVAVSAIQRTTLRVLRPLRAPWLGEALGPRQEVAWLEHAPSRITLRLEPELLGALVAAATSEGPTPIPERAQRFLERLAGWEEQEAERSQPLEDQFAVLERPRGDLVACASVQQTSGGFSYAE